MPRTDVESTAWREFIGAWWQEHESRDVGIAELYPLAVSIEGFRWGKRILNAGKKRPLGAPTEESRLRHERLSNHRRRAPSKRGAVEVHPGGRRNAGTKPDPERRSGEGEHP